MSDLISRQDALDAVNDCGICIQKILDIPSAEPEERTAKVTEVKTDDDVYDIKGVHTWCKEYRCEKCGFIQFAIEDHGRYTYCPSCGCRLEWE